MNAAAPKQSARPLRLLLRDETRGVHEALHGLADFASLAQARIARRDYGDLLLRLESFYAALDPLLERAALCVAPDVIHAPRAPLLARDLAAIGLQPRRSATPALPQPATPAALAGALYVFDGALIGGTTLARAAGCLDWDAPTAFWDWCRDSGPGLWRRTLALLACVDDSPESRAAALGTANAMFQSFGDWMASPETVA